MRLGQLTSHSQGYQVAPPKGSSKMAQEAKVALDQRTSRNADRAMPNEMDLIKDEKVERDSKLVSCNCSLGDSRLDWQSSQG